jgi:hypothetical protein
MHDIAAMAKAAKKARKRPAKRDEILGYTPEGLPVWKPSLPPKSFTVAELERVMREIKQREAAARAAG